MKNNLASFEFVAKLPYTLKKRKKHVLASCPILDVHSQGETEKKAKANLQEALSLFLISCIERDTLDVVLKDCGFKAASAKIKFSPQSYVEVPIPFLPYSSASLSCLA